MKLYTRAAIKGYTSFFNLNWKELKRDMSIRSPIKPFLRKLKEAGLGQGSVMGQL